MAVRGLDEWETDFGYSRDQVREVAISLGIEVVTETDNDFLCYCPFHSNTQSPSFTVGAENGLYICHNASCRGNDGGNLMKLVMMLSERNDTETVRFIKKKGSETQKPLSESIKHPEEKVEFTSISQKKIDKLSEHLWANQRAQNYLMKERGFDKETLITFEAGYDPVKDMVVIPIHDKNGNPIGVNGRSVEGKRFKLTKHMPKKKILFNMHRAKKSGGTAIFCESQFDVMKIHQAGYPNAVCALGSHISREQAALLQRNFDRVIIMTDADKAGRKAGRTLASMLPGSSVEWAVHDWGIIYPRKAKDAGDMTSEEISHVINNAASDLQYNSYRKLA